MSSEADFANGYMLGGFELVIEQGGVRCWLFLKGDRVRCERGKAGRAKFTVRGTKQVAVRIIQIHC